MKHHYSTIDNIHTTFSDIYSSETKGESIIVHLERPTETLTLRSFCSPVLHAPNAWALQKMS